MNKQQEKMETLNKKLDRIKMLRQSGDEVGSFHEAMNLIQSLKEENDKLQVFKDYVHKRLDDAGIEKEPDGEHSKHGCRIGDRLDIVLSLQQQVEEKDKLLLRFYEVTNDFYHPQIDWIRGKAIKLIKKDEEV